MIAMKFVSDIARQIGWIDILDVGLVAIIIYALLAWLRRSIPESTARRILFAAPIAAGVYILVRLLDLYLLESVVRVLFIVLLIVAVVVFQADIRRMFDRVVSRTRARQTPKSGSAATIDRITEATSRMMELKMGALIAIKGREPLDSLIDGGIELDGVLTQPLLFSIFHPDTPGHDGAVVVDDDRVVKFAAHLPLTTNVPYVSRYGGTRHAAALGLSEVSDSFIIAVSEESGTLSIAQEGTLTQDVEVSTLRSKLESFWSENYEESTTPSPSWWRRPNLQTAGVAALMAILFWLVIVYSPDTVIRSMVVPIEFRNLPDEWTIEGNIPAGAEVVLSGPEQLFLRLDPVDLALSIDASDPEEGSEEIVLTEADLNLPAGIDLNRIQPQVIQLEMRRMETLRVPVTVRTTGRLREPLTLTGLQAEPDSVSIVVPRGDFEPDAKVYTQAVDLGEIQDNASVTRRLVLPEYARLTSRSSDEIVVHVSVRAAEADADTSALSMNETLGAAVFSIQGLRR